jgi:hypothetical protein
VREGERRGIAVTNYSLLADDTLVIARTNLNAATSGGRKDIGLMPLLMLLVRKWLCRLLLSRHLCYKPEHA